MYHRTESFFSLQFVPFVSSHRVKLTPLIFWLWARSSAKLASIRMYLIIIFMCIKWRMQMQSTQVHGYKLKWTWFFDGIFRWINTDSALLTWKGHREGSEVIKLLTNRLYANRWYGCESIGFVWNGRFHATIQTQMGTDWNGFCNKLYQIQIDRFVEDWSQKCLKYEWNCIDTCWNGVKNSHFHCLQIQSEPNCVRCLNNAQWFRCVSI